MKIDQTKLVPEDILQQLEHKQYFMPDASSNQFLKLLQQKMNSNAIDRNTAKALAGSFCPYETTGILTR